MARERIRLVPEEEVKEKEIQFQIEENLMTNKVYEALTPEEQNKVKEVLFEMHSAPVIPPVAFSGLEFTIFGFAKLMFKMQEGALTEKEQLFYDRFKEFIMQHEISLDAGDWYIPYAEDAMLKTKDNREEYKERKTDITGSFFS